MESDTPPPAIIEDIEKMIEPKPVATNEKVPAVTAPIIQKTEIIAS